MSTITKERLTKILIETMALIKERSSRTGNSSGISTEVNAELFAEITRIALASLEAEPAIHRWRRVTVEPYGPYPWHYGNFIGFSKPVEGIEDEYFYSAPPAPVSDSLLSELLSIAKRAADEADECAHAEFSDDSMEHSAAIADWERRAAMLQSFGNSEQLNSPVIPDGWKLVPIELTGDMTNAMSEAILDDLHNVDVWRSVLAAAPQQEVKP